MGDDRMRSAGGEPEFAPSRRQRHIDIVKTQKLRETAGQSISPSFDTLTLPEPLFEPEDSRPCVLPVHFTFTPTAAPCFNSAGGAEILMRTSTSCDTELISGAIV